MGAFFLHLLCELGVCDSQVMPDGYVYAHPLVLIRSVQLDAALFLARELHGGKDRRFIRFFG